VSARYARHANDPIADRSLIVVALARFAGVIAAMFAAAVIVAIVAIAASLVWLKLTTL